MPQDQGRDDGDLVGLKDVGGHPGAVANVIPHQVGDDGRIAGVILRDPDLHLPHQVGPDVGGFGVDAAADPHKEGQQGATEAEAQESIGRGAAENHKDDGAAQEPQAVGEHAGEGAGPVGDGECAVVTAAHRLSGYPDVALNGDPHPQLAHQQGEDGP